MSHDSDRVTPLGVAGVLLLLALIGTCSYQMDKAMCKRMIRGARTSTDSSIVYAARPYKDGLSCGFVLPERAP